MPPRKWETKGDAPVVVGHPAPGGLVVVLLVAVAGVGHRAVDFQVVVVVLAAAEAVEAGDVFILIIKKHGISTRIAM